MDLPPNVVAISVFHSADGRFARIEIDMHGEDTVTISIPEFLLQATLDGIDALAAPAPVPIPDTMLVECSPRPGEECSVCLHEMLDGVVTLRRCGHFFHSHCIRQWGSPSCPNCRENYGGDV